ncbi:MAG: hypothetical protein E7365_01075 [Clostridiales bacterium]|nr:hypothetical protein [Clostridiales bacterium]
MNLAFQLDFASITDSLKVTAIGILVVFAILAIIIVLIEALHTVLKDKKEEAPAPAVEKKVEKRISAGVMADVPDADNAQNDPEFIAAVSSAITCVTGNANFKIKSIKKG